MILARHDAAVRTFLYGLRRPKDILFDCARLLYDLLMKIHVGSMNKTKVAAVADAVLLYPTLFPDPEVVGQDVVTDLFGHPKSLAESADGAVARAQRAFGDCAYSFGLESGLVAVPHTTTGYIEIAVCAVYDGQRSYLGLSTGFEWPTEVTRMVASGEADASTAFHKLGLTEHEKLGAQDGGVINYLTNGRYTREDQTKHSIIMALIQLERPELYTLQQK